MATVPAEVVSSAPVDKVRLCELLGWSRPTLDKRLREDQNFPVLQAGEGRGVPWKFDAAAVLAYVQHGTLSHERAPAPEPRAASHPVAVASPAPAVVVSPSAVVAKRDTSGRVVHQGEQTAAERLKLAQAILQEDKAARARGELVDAELMRQTLTMALSQLGKELEGLADSIPRRLALPDTAAAVIREMLDERRKSFVVQLRELLDPQ